MTIEKAIKTLIILEHRSTNNSTMFKKDALKLGIEALKEIQLIRLAISTGGWRKLPEETDGG